MYKELIVVQSICGEAAAILDERYPGCFDDAHEQFLGAANRYANNDVVHCSDIDLNAMLRSALQAITKFAPLPADLDPLVKEFHELFSQGSSDESDDLV